MKKLTALVLAGLSAFLFYSCNSDSDRWYDSMKDGGPFVDGNNVRFYYVDEDGNDLIDPSDLSTLPVSSAILLDTPPEPPADMQSNGRYNYDPVWSHTDGYCNAIQYLESVGLHQFFTYVYGDSRYSDYTFYVYFEGKPVEMKVRHRYQNGRVNDGADYLSSLVSWEADGVLVYPNEEHFGRQEVVIRKTNKGLTVSLKE